MFHVIPDLLPLCVLCVFLCHFILKYQAHRRNQHAIWRHVRWRSFASIDQSKSDAETSFTCPLNYQQIVFVRRCAMHKITFAKFSTQKEPQLLHPIALTLTTTSNGRVSCVTLRLGFLRKQYTILCVCVCVCVCARARARACVFTWQ